MHILFLTQVLPYPLDAGPKVRAYYVLRHLCRDHQVTLVSFTRPTDTDEAVAHLQEFCHAVHTMPMPRAKWRDGLHLARSLVANKSFIIARDWVPAMADRIARIMQEDGPFQAVHADQLWMAPYALWAKDVAPEPKPLAVLDQHNAVYMIPKRMADDEQNPAKRFLLQNEARKLANFEVEICRRFDQVVWVTETDYAALQAQAGSRTLPNAGIIPICVEPVRHLELEPAPASRRRVTFLGGLHYPPNAQGICWFTQRVWPAVLQAAPDACLTVIGKQPPTCLDEAGIPAANLHVTGYVDDPRPLLAETAVFIVPLLAGGGMRVKILDAWSWGLPMVSTTIGAEGIAIEPGENLLIADEPATFADAVIRLLTDQAFNRRVADNGYAWIHEEYNWRTAYRAWDAVYAAAPEPALAQ